MAEWIWTEARFKKLSDILAGFGHLAFASVVIPYVLDTKSVLLRRGIRWYSGRSCILGAQFGGLEAIRL